MDHDPGHHAHRAGRRTSSPADLGRRGVLRLLAATPAAILLAAPGCCHLLDPDPRADADAAADGLGRQPDPAEEPWRRPPPAHEPLVRIRVGSAPARSPIRIGAAGEPVLVDRPPSPVLVAATDQADAPDLEPRRTSGAESTILRGPVEIRRDERERGWTYRDAEGRRGLWTDADTDADADAGAGDSARDEPPSPLELARPRPDLGDVAVGGAPGSELRGPVDWNGIAWPGRLRLVAGADRTHVVAVVPMETYIPGVLARELFAGWRDATFAAQAIAARSFATFELLARAGRAWDVEADQRSQVFAGGTTLAQALDAGAATAGEVLTYDGGVLPAYYSSTCGGIGMPARLAIGPAPVNALPPFAGHRLDCCEDAPRFRWTATRSLGRLREQLRAWGATAGSRR